VSDIYISADTLRLVGDLVQCYEYRRSRDVKHSYGAMNRFDFGSFEFEFEVDRHTAKRRVRMTAETEKVRWLMNVVHQWN